MCLNILIDTTISLIKHFIPLLISTITLSLIHSLCSTFMLLYLLTSRICQRHLHLFILERLIPHCYPKWKAGVRSKSKPAQMRGGIFAPLLRDPPTCRNNPSGGKAKVTDPSSAYFCLYTGILENIVHNQSKKYGNF